MFIGYGKRGAGEKILARAEKKANENTSEKGNTTKAKVSSKKTVVKEEKANG